MRFNLLPFILLNLLLGIGSVYASLNIYSNAGSGMLSLTAKNALSRVYVPNTEDNTVSVIDPKTYQVVAAIKTGNRPEHVVPAYDLKTLWIVDYFGSSVIPIDPNTAKPGKKITVQHPYNMYFTPDGRYAMTVDDVEKRLDFRHPQTMKLHDSTSVKCNGVNHMDFSVDGKFAIATCEKSSALLKLDVLTHKVIAYLPIGLNSDKKSMPQDIRLSPDGRIFYVADMSSNGVFLIDAKQFRQVGFIKTGIETHSITPSRDGKFFYVSNRGCKKMKNCPAKGEGSITVLDPIAKKIVATWPIPGGGSPDMGNINADGKELWLSGKYDHEVYVFDTTTGKLTHRIPVGQFPHGLAVWPQPGRYSLGHTGNMR